MSQLQPNVITGSREVSSWQGLYKVAAVSSIVMLILIPIQIFIYVCWPPPETVEGFFALYQNNWFLGLLSLDLLYIVNSIIMLPMYMAFFVALKKVSLSYMALALVIGIVGIAVYFPSNPSFEMLSLSSQFSSAATEAQRLAAMASGQTFLAIYTGTSFNVYYVLSTITLLIMSVVMLRSSVFSRATGYTGLLAGIFMIIPSSAGTLGLIFSLLSLIPWSIFILLAALRFLQLAKQVR